MSYAPANLPREVLEAALDDAVRCMRDVLGLDPARPVVATQEKTLARSLARIATLLDDPQVAAEGPTRRPDEDQRPQAVARQPLGTPVEPTPLVGRAVTGEDLRQLTAGQQVLAPRRHAGTVYYQHGVITDVRRRDVLASKDTPEGLSVQGTVGQRVQVTVRTQIGSDATFVFYDSPRAETTATRERPKPVRERPPLLLEVPAGTLGSVTVQEVPVYGSQVTIPAFLPGMNPAQATAAVHRVLTALPAGAHVPTVHARPVEDLRVDVLVRGNLGDTLVATRVLGAEASYHRPPDVKGALLTVER